ncbi:DNA polymerase III subunit epsilon [Thioalkalivibrio sp. HK1]|uniref:DNA polymerase III subunit epsilon n=1 Tax=Thioalkalivibrio sp. HK1 TaxID=1469245 RepID=UPI0004BAD776|nr:DNA polymerase III subunit epsilon [Thioalkalivibrio sp. HK1]
MDISDHIDRIVFLDTETTGFAPDHGHRIVEIGAVECDRNYDLTGYEFQTYLDPQRDIPSGAFQVHGLSRSFLADQPLFARKAHAFIEFVEGALVIIHNARFDTGFLDHEFKIAGRRERMEAIATIACSVRIAKSIHPDESASLDALCARYGVDNSHRNKHGALLDAHLLARMFRRMIARYA